MNIKNFLKKSTLLTGLRNIKLRYFRHYRRKLGYCASDAFIVSPSNLVGLNNIFLYENTGIAAGSTILARNAKFIMKRNSGAAPGLFVATGNHERRIGRFYRTITESEKDKSKDKDVVVEEDCWIAGNAALLCGVTVKRGSTIANGAVVVKDTAPYSVWGGYQHDLLSFTGR